MLLLEDLSTEAFPNPAACSGAAAQIRLGRTGSGGSLRRFLIFILFFLERFIGGEVECRRGKGVGEIALLRASYALEKN